MADQHPKMGKRFFGYDKASVERMLLERDAMLKVAERRVSSAEQKAAKLEERLAALEKARETEPSIAAANAGARGPAARQPTYEASREVSAEQAPEELAKAVTAAETSANQIIEAWMSTREQIMQADKLWRAVQEEVVKFSAWRDDVQPVMDFVQSTIQDAIARIEEVPGRVQHALEPAVDAMVTVSEGMSRFADVSTIPLLPLRPEVPDQPSDSDEGAEAEAAEEPSAEAEVAAQDRDGEEGDVDSAGFDEYSIAHLLPADHPSRGWRRDPEAPGPEAGQVDRLTEAAVTRGTKDSGQEYFEG
jgi:chromosome segregation ATPase